MALFTLDKRKCLLSWNIMYAYLTSAVLSICIYDTECNKLIDLGEYSCGIDNPVLGNIDLETAFKDNEVNNVDDIICKLIEGDLNIKINTHCNPNGEIKGHIKIKTSKLEKPNYDTNCDYNSGNNCENVCNDCHDQCEVKYQPPLCTCPDCSDCSDNL